MAWAWAGELALHDISPKLNSHRYLCRTGVCLSLFSVAITITGWVINKEKISLFLTVLGVGKSKVKELHLMRAFLLVGSLCGVTRWYRASHREAERAC